MDVVSRKKIHIDLIHYIENVYKENILNYSKWSIYMNYS